MSTSPGDPAKETAAEWWLPFEEEVAAVRDGLVEDQRPVEYDGYFTGQRHPLDWTPGQIIKEAAFVHFYRWNDRSGWLIVWQGGTRLRIQIAPVVAYHTWWLDPAIAQARNAPAEAREVA